MDDPAFGRLFDRFAQSRVVLLGESTSGSAEFQSARAQITRRLIEKHGFNVLALDADARDAAVLDAVVRPRDRMPRRREAFSGFPAWRWRNREFDELLVWLARHNRTQLERERVGVHGLDAYNISDAQQAALSLLDASAPEAAAVARVQFGGQTPWTSGEPGRDTSAGRYAANEVKITGVLADRLRRSLRDAADDREPSYDPARAERLSAGAEAHCRTLYFGGSGAWNARQQHMFETLQAVIAAQGPDARTIIWSHNAAVGDGRATPMGRVQGDISLGQLCREAYQDRVSLIGMGTFGGAVACASDWGGPMEISPLPAAAPESLERLAHETGIVRFLLDLRPDNTHGAVRRALIVPRLQRLIGPVYRPEIEGCEPGMACSIPDQFDAYVWFDQTTPVRPLPEGAAAYWPFGR